MQITEDALVRQTTGTMKSQTTVQDKVLLAPLTNMSVTRVCGFWLPMTGEKSINFMCFHTVRCSSWTICWVFRTRRLFLRDRSVHNLLLSRRLSVLLVLERCSLTSSGDCLQHRLKVVKGWFNHIGPWEASVGSSSARCIAQKLLEMGWK